MFACTFEDLTINTSSCINAYKVCEKVCLFLQKQNR